MKLGQGWERGKAVKWQLRPVSDHAPSSVRNGKKHPESDLNPIWIRPRHLCPLGAASEWLEDRALPLGESASPTPDPG